MRSTRFEPRKRPTGGMGAAALSTRGASPMYEEVASDRFVIPVGAHEQANAISYRLLAGCHYRHFAPAALLLDQPKDRSASLQPVSAIAPGGQGRPGCGVRSLHTGHLQRPAATPK